jgi:hypothetical protein
MNVHVLLNVFCRLKYRLFGGDIADFESCSLLLEVILAMLGALLVISRHLSSEASSMVYFWRQVWGGICA